MEAIMVGRLTQVALREVWKNEAKDFTSWLENNLDILSEQINFKLSALEREKAVGPFSVDIYADGPNGPVVIENQLEKTDHTHLGQIITYLSNLEAKTAIWITSNPQPEHITAINWMNEIAPADVGFFLVKVEAYKIGDSEPAPLFTAICEPSAEGKIISDTKRDLVERSVNNLEFWSQLLKKAQNKTGLHSNVSPSKSSWISAGAGKSGMGYSYALTADKAWVELFIDRGPEKEQETYTIYEKLLSEKESIEKKFGEPLLWDKKEGRRVCRIKSFSKFGGIKETDSWGKIQDDLVDRMARLEKAFKNVISKIN
jgi:hypothetical protein